MCDDFENIDQIILPVVARQCAKLGFAVERTEIVTAVSDLVMDGLVKAYDLSGGEEGFKTYFYPTKKGIDFHLSDGTWWPFDEEENVLPNWRLDPPPLSG